MIGAAERAPVPPMRTCENPFIERKIATLRADWTNKDPRITAELAAYGRSAVPFNVIWKPGRDQPEILPELPQCVGARHVSGIAALQIPTFRITNGPVGLPQSAAVRCIPAKL